MGILARRWEPVAVAVIIRDEDGNLMIVGSKELNTATFTIETDAEDLSPFIGSRHYLATRHIYRIETECRSVLWQRTAPVPTPPQIEQRGIYLPDMSFRALPGPKED